MSDQTLRESVAAQMRAAADNYQISTIGPGDARQIADLLDAPVPAQVERDRATATHSAPFDVAYNIVNQLGDLWNVPVDVRQASNDRCWAFAAGLISAFVAKQPAPARVEITDEAAMAAARVLGGPNPPAMHVEAAREALEAALPLLGPRPLLDREAVRTELIQFGIDLKMEDLHPEVGASEMVDRRVDAVLRLARPMPTREEIARAQYNQDVAESRQVPNDWDNAGDIVRGAYLNAADAVLALLNGSES